MKSKKVGDLLDDLYEIYRDNLELEMLIKEGLALIFKKISDSKKFERKDDK